MTTISFAFHLYKSIMKRNYVSCQDSRPQKTGLLKWPTFIFAVKFFWRYFIVTFEIPWLRKWEIGGEEIVTKSEQGGEKYHIYGKSLNHLSPNEMNTFLIATKLKALTDEKSNCPSFKYLTRSKSSPENVCSTRTSFFQWDFLAQNCVHNGNNVCTMQIMNKAFHG